MIRIYRWCIDWTGEIRSSPSPVPSLPNQIAHSTWDTSTTIQPPRNECRVSFWDWSEQWFKSVSGVKKRYISEEEGTCPKSGRTTTFLVQLHPAWPSHKLCISNDLWTKPKVTQLHATWVLGNFPTNVQCPLLPLYCSRSNLSFLWTCPLFGQFIAWIDGDWVVDRVCVESDWAPLIWKLFQGFGPVTSAPWFDGTGR